MKKVLLTMPTEPPITDPGNAMDPRTQAKLDKIHRRQVARFLDHLRDRGRLTLPLEKDIKRSFGFVFQDVADAINTGPDKETRSHDEPEK